MTVDVFINIVVVLLNLIGTYFMARGLLSLSPKDILKSHPTYSSVYHSKAEMTVMVKNRIETAMGIIIIIFAVGLQIMLFVNDSWKLIFINTGVTVFLSLCLILIFFFLTKTVIPKYIEKKVTEVNKYYVISEVQSGNCPFTNSGFFARRIEDYFGLFKQEGETDDDFVERVATNYLKLEVQRYTNEQRPQQ
ncbi:hypothetical protein [Anaerospora hongkongensis]|uniref:hypothetical protein n=1 Tax=Anaerospora hongkongensis TaxID=244830 RepID=UPI002FD8B8A7